MWFVLGLLLLSQMDSSCRAELAIRQVMPEKIFYKPGETVKVAVTVDNPDATPASGRVKVELVHDIDTTVVIGEAAVDVEAKGSKEISFTTTAQPWLGIEARSTLLRDGKSIASKSEYFTCARTVHQVLIVGLGNTLMSGNYAADKAEAIAKYAADTYRKYYGNYWEWFAWAPSDYDDMTPDNDRWWAGQAQYNESQTNMRATNAALARQGTQVISYGKAAGGGPITFELFRRHPEWASYFEGRPSIENYDSGHLDYLAALGPPKANEESGVPLSPEQMEKAGYKGVGWYQAYAPPFPVWSAVWYDSNNDEVVRYGSEQMGKSALQLGFQGVRFDGEFAAFRHQTMDGSWNGPANFDMDAADARLVRNMKKTTWALKPGYLFAYNTALNFRWNVKANNTVAAFREKCKDDGLIAREELAFPNNAPWEDYIKVVRHDSDLARYYGGHMATYPFLRNPRFLYPYLITSALRAHVMFGYVGQQDAKGELQPNLSRFLTRWAGPLWDDDVHAWAQAKDEIAVHSDRAVWWEPFAAVRPLDGGKRTQYIVHLINPPEGKTTLGEKNDGSPLKVPDDGWPAANAKDVVVRWKKPKGFKRAYVADLERGDLQPVATRMDGDELVLTIPDFKYWSILMMEADGSTPAPVWELSKEEANLKLPSLQDLGLAVSDTSKWSLVLQGEEYTSPQNVAKRSLDLDAKFGAALRSTPGAPAGGYIAVGTYFYPRIPGHYMAKFRLKVADNTSDQQVIRIGIPEVIDKPLDGVPSLSSPMLALKGTDFKEANKYQEFEVPFETGDIGYRAMMLLYGGSGDVSWDQTSLELLKPWNAQELEQYYSSQKAPTNLQLADDGKLDVLLMRGLWNRVYKIDEAAARLPGGTDIGTAYANYNQNSNTVIKGFDLDWAPLYSKDLMVLTNVETRGIAFGKVKMLKQWVRDGGGLVVLGGLMTLGQNSNMLRGWPELLPVQLSGPYEVRKCVPAVSFGVPSKDLGVDIKKWQSAPQVMYRHMVTAKAGAKVLLAGSKGEPLLVGWNYGKGRVVVFTGTVLGDAPAGKVAFWKSPAWPGLLAAAMKWAHGNAGVQ